MVNYSVNAGEKEFIFPPFSFFKIEKVVEKGGIPSDPHVIYMSVPNKKMCLNLDLKIIKQFIIIKKRMNYIILK